MSESMGYNLFIVHWHGDQMGAKCEFSSAMVNRSTVVLPLFASIFNGHYLLLLVMPITVHPEQSLGEV